MKRVEIITRPYKLDEIKEAESMIAERGLSRGEVSTALAGNPAVIEEEQ